MRVYKLSFESVDTRRVTNRHFLGRKLPDVDFLGLPDIFLDVDFQVIYLKSESEHKAN